MCMCHLLSGWLLACFRVVSIAVFNMCPLLSGWLLACFRVAGIAVFNVCPLQSGWWLSCFRVVHIVLWTMDQLESGWLTNIVMFQGCTHCLMDHVPTRVDGYPVLLCFRAVAIALRAGRMFDWTLTVWMKQIKSLWMTCLVYRTVNNTHTTA